MNSIYTVSGWLLLYPLRDTTGWSFYPLGGIKG